VPAVSIPWQAPAADRADPDRATAERLALEQWLDYQRATLLTKCAGLTGEQLAERAVSPSSMSLLGLVRHLTEVERWWFRRHAGGESLGDVYCTEERPDADFDDARAGDAPADLDRFTEEVAAARAAADGKALDDIVPSRGHRKDVTMNIRWIYLHMIEEYARHNGHADLLRERVDGATGD